MQTKEPEKTTIYYVTDEIQQSQYINMFRENGMDAVILKHNIDSRVHHPSGAARMKMSTSRELMRMSPTACKEESQADAEELRAIR